MYSYFDETLANQPLFDGRQEYSTE